MKCLQFLPNDAREPTTSEVFGGTRKTKIARS